MYLRKAAAYRFYSSVRGVMDDGLTVKLTITETMLGMRVVHKCTWHQSTVMGRFGGA